ncbi:hypothetical protein P171DRAFT_435078 [Karstenula rhodostoma CBS 690.94]|uniref:Fungal N-terminal domain-containing protein n=1 Tax=Karstenula rhodostoma CBS 690.94 TaxID=1392251 RepID=A0A9P4PAG2_9PLEO|nr:hypothetical protein P171DRAFT_435078 [Karstenula rhodostoma CBS 690.94]
MTDPFSVAASSFAVVGVADVVLRTCLKCHQFLSDIEDAPASIDDLKTCLRNNTSLVQTLRKHIQDLEATASPSDRAELQPAIEQFKVAIGLLRREMATLLARASKYNRMRKTWANVRHVLAEKDIRKTTERMEHAKSTLSVALSLVEGKRSAIDHKKTGTAIIQTSTQVISAIGQLQNEQTTIVSQNNTIISHTVQQKQGTRETQREIQRFRHVSQKQHDNLRRQMGRDTNLIVKKLEDIHISSSHRLTKRESNRRIFLRGADQEKALTTLLLMKEHVRQAAVKNIAYTKEGISQQDMNLFLSEFNHLVSSAVQETAAQHPDSTARPLDRWCYSGSSGGSLPTNYLADNSPWRRDQTHDLTPSLKKRPDGRSSLRTSRRYWIHQTIMGKLIFMITGASEGDIQEQDVVESRLIFIPHAHVHPVVATVRFTQAKNMNVKLQLYTQLNIFRPVSYYDAGVHYALYTHGSIEDIDTAFREGRITPYDVTENGIILSQYIAGAVFRADILRYLDSQGVGHVALNGDGDVMLGIWYHMHDKVPEYVWNRHDDMQSYLDGRINSFTSNSGVQVALGGRGASGYIDPDPERVQRWRGFLVRNGIVDEFRDKDFKRAFMYYCYSPHQNSVANLAMFLELGMDPNTMSPTNSTGRNGLHESIRHRSKGRKWKYKRHPVSERRVLEKKLVVLIKAGTSIHHRDSDGHTPSIYARGYNWWDVWCRALERAGFNIDEMLEVENNEWLQEAGWEEKLLDMGGTRGGRSTSAGMRIRTRKRTVSQTMT